MLPKIKTFDELTTRELYEILRSRAEIFVVEQDCVYQDLDCKDYYSWHVFCENDDGRVSAYLRLFWRDEEKKTLQLGRVITLVHGTGLGGTLLHAGMEYAKNVLKAESVYLEAQTYAVGYYQKEDFRVLTGEIITVDNLPHVAMGWGNI